MRAIGGNIKNIRTAVFYRWNKFFPTITTRDLDDLENLKEEFYGYYYSTEVFYLSEDSTSDFLDFAEYGFKFDPEKKDYKSEVITNYFSKETINQAKTSSGKLDFTKINYLNNYMFPTVFDEQGEDSRRKYFGMVSNNSFDIIFLKLPSEDLSNNSNGIWKVELYNDYIETNNTYINSEGNKYPFIEYSVLEEFKNISNEIREATEGLDLNQLPIDLIEGVKPGLILEFGPSRNSAENFEYSNHFYHQMLPDGSDYSDLMGNLINENNWIDLCREISSGKLLSVMITPDNSIESINFSKIAWESSKNPNRNQSEYSLRNDRFKYTKNNVSGSTKINNNLIIDSTSGVLLSTGNLGKVDIYGSGINSNVPIISAKVKRLKHKYSRSRVYSEGDAVCYNGNLYISLIPGNCGECPMFSKYWKFIKKYEGEFDKDIIEYLSDKTNSLKKLNETLRSDYIYYNLEVNHLSCIINPVGKVSIRPNSQGFPRSVNLRFNVPVDFNLSVNSEFPKTSYIESLKDNYDCTVKLEVYDNGVLKEDEEFVGLVKFDEGTGNKSGVIKLIEPEREGQIYNNSLERCIRILFDRDALGILVQENIILYKSRYNSLSDINEEDFSIKFSFTKVISEDSSKCSLQIDEISSDNSRINTNLYISVYYLDSFGNRYYLNFLDNQDNKFLFSFYPESINSMVESDLRRIYFEIEERNGGSSYELTRLLYLNTSETQNEDRVISDKDILLISSEDENLKKTELDKILTSKFLIGLVRKEHECKVIPTYGLDSSSLGDYIPDNSNYEFKFYSNYADKLWRLRLVPVLNGEELEDTQFILDEIHTFLELKLQDGDILAVISIVSNSDNTENVVLSQIKSSFNIYLEYY